MVHISKSIFFDTKEKSVKTYLKRKETNTFWDIPKG